MDISVGGPEIVGSRWLRACCLRWPWDFWPCCSGGVRLSWRRSTSGIRNPSPSRSIKWLRLWNEPFKRSAEIPRFFPWLKEQLKDTPAFFRDTKLNLNIRTYYFYRDKYDDSKSEAWALGGALSYQSGWFLDHFGVGAVLYTSQRLYGPDDRDGTLLLKPGQAELHRGRTALWKGETH